MTTPPARLKELCARLDRESLETLIDLLDGTSAGRLYAALCQEHRERYPALYDDAPAPTEPQFLDCGNGFVLNLPEDER